MNHNVIITDEKYKGINPMHFGFQDCEESHSFGPAVRTYWLIHFVVSGFGYYKIGNREYNLGPGEMFVIPPYVETYYEADSEKPWSYIWVGFTSDSDLPVELKDTIHCPEALSIFSRMKNCREKSNGRSAFLCARLWELFEILLERTNDNNTDYINLALDCIHSEYMNPLTIEDIAKRLNLDRSYFSTLFKKTVGVSPKQYLLDYRMNMAASLLTDNRKSVSVTATSVGYSDVYTFSKMFKQHFGISPTEYVSKRKKRENKSPKS